LLVRLVVLVVEAQRLVLPRQLVLVVLVFLGREILAVFLLAVLVVHLEVVVEAQVGQVNQDRMFLPVHLTLDSVAVMVVWVLRQLLLALRSILLVVAVAQPTKPTPLAH